METEPATPLAPLVPTAPPAAPARAAPSASAPAPLPAIDVGEFDPFATPAPALGPGGSGGRAGLTDLGALDLVPTPAPAEPAKAAAGAAGAADAAGTSGGAGEAGGAAAALPRLELQEISSAESVAPAGKAGSSRPSTPARALAPGDAADAGAATPRAAGTGPGGEAGAGAGRDDTDEPAFNFSGFLRDLRGRGAEPVARYLKSFLSNFAKKPFTVNEQIKLIRDFLAFIEEKMRAAEPWKTQSEAEFDNALEAMEKLVMNRLYQYTFTPSLDPAQPITTDDLERDAVFTQRVRLFSWVRERHLDVPEGEAAQGFLGFAEQELLKINHYKAPRDKMICILNCCKVIFGLIRHTLGAENTSADAFVPILIFVVLQANPDHMLSNIEYINRFRNPDKLLGEAGYYLSSLTGAIAFIETMDASSLSAITQEEFEDSVERAIRDLPASPSRVRQPVLPAPSPARDGRERDPFATADGDEPARALAMTPAFAIEGTRRFFARTGTLAQEAVSRPLGAIGKILDGMQSEERERVRLRADRAGPAARQADWEDGAETPTRRGRRRPASPSERFAQLGISPDSRSIPGTPLYETAPIPPPDFSRHDIQAATDSSNADFERARRANVGTLNQMFPALDEETLEAVLAACGDDLGVAIDRLLEM